eukprot:CAMPEP_0198339874 /NCGR_PEP_ID=MMETSP1450-20131203/41547_1 /TAXON_ID=753684 ORGANISM="Madagascaria erythrocladiodes, Strain CCMP3234" /NCGR_SAMPLE_ID=MMETSP1450 /ASSEMBLY_ACC=CAM_ASM_001115 /LENGTH=1712 /DNA_ID=CAMNT_0044044827 /DNA_START=107 /DNA_END=5242 /DNA_ORIENTATION=+
MAGAAGQQIPIKFTELLNLAQAGVQPASISFKNVTMESEKYVCVRDGNQVVIINTANWSQPMRRPVSADCSAIMSPTRPLLALKAGRQLQVYNVEAKSKVAECTLSDDVAFWKWLSATTLALVTATAVLHWTVEGDGAGGEPRKVFERHAQLAACQIINYRGDATGKWLCVVGISKDGARIKGTMQLYSVDKQVSQVIEGHACAFASFKCAGATAPSTMFSFAVRTAAGAKCYVLEVEKGDGSQFQKKAVDMMFPAEAADDFPIGMQVSPRYGIIFVLTKFGYLHLFELGTGTLVFRNRISQQSVFATAFHHGKEGIIAVNMRGQVLVVTIDDDNVVQFVVNTVKNVPVAIALASRANLPGADQLFAQQFQAYFQQGNYKQAATVAAASPGTVLRNENTIKLFQSLPAVPGQPSPLLQYFGTLLEKGKLNRVESMELVRPVLAQNKKQLLEGWLREDKLECSEALGDLVKPHDTTLALSVYFRAEAHQKVVLCFAETGAYDKIVAYASKANFTPDYAAILGGVVASNPAAAASFAKMLLTNEAGALADPNQVMDVFMQRQLVQEVTGVMLEYLKANRADQGPLQTRILEINLQFAPQVADAILGNEMFTHYNRQRVAQLCEKAGLVQRALEHYTDPKDVRRVLTQVGSAPGGASGDGGAVSQTFLTNYFGTLSVEDTLDILRDMLRANMRGNLQTVVQIAVKYSDQITPAALIAMFEQFKCYDGVFYYLGQIVNESEDAEVHFKYLEAAARTRNFAEVERIARDSNHYEPPRVRDFLMQAKLPDQLPLIIVCDRFSMVDSLTKYLYKNNMSRYIEAYVQQINPANAAAVVGALLDCNCNDDYIKKLVMSIRGMCPVDALVEETSKRNRLKLLHPWLEARIAEGNQEPATHNAIAKIYIDLNKQPEEFLKTNLYYDSRVVGAYCEKRDPYLAFVAYKRGACDDELLATTSAHGLFKHQARYLVERQDEALWARVLTDDNEHKQQVIDQVVQTALPETKNPEEVSSTVKAFIAANLPTELIELLEKIVLDSGADNEFSGNRNLQNLLILTAIKADPSRVMEYINRLDNYDGAEIAPIAVGASLFEEAHAIYKKTDAHVEAAEVLIVHIGDLARAQEYADKVGVAAVHSRLGRAQMEAGDVEAAIASFLAAEDADYYRELIVAADQAQLYEPLIKYLRMARPIVSESGDPHCDTELCYALARAGDHAALEEFITAPNIARIEEVGDRCYDARMYKAARLLYAAIDNYARLASCHIKLGDHSAAADAAKKAGSVKTWKEVCLACVDAKEYVIAQACGLNVVTHGDELEDLLSHYERRGAPAEAIELLERALATAAADDLHKGIYTELAILYSKYREEALLEFLRQHAARMHVQKATRACEQNLQWAELTYLYRHNDEHDNAALTMIGHSARAWEHTAFKEVLAKVNNVELCYKGVQFYLEEHPTLVCDLLKAVVDKVDHSRVVALVRKLHHLPLVRPYLLSVQETNTQAVNEALHELYVDEEDFDALRKSVDTHSAFDALALAKTCEAHGLLELRRVAAYLYARNKRYEEAMELSKRDRLYKDAMRTARESEQQELAEQLLRYFVEIESPECFAACLYTCYELIRPDVALELAWRNKYLDYAMPYLVQYLREADAKLDTVHKHCFPPKKKTQEGDDDDDKSAFDTSGGFGLGQTLQIEYNTGVGAAPVGMMPPGMMPGGGGMAGAVPGMMPPGGAA